MLFHNIKHIIRSLLRYKSFTFINLLGLSIGLAAVLIIFSIARYEKSFDKFHSNAEHIYRVVTRKEGADKLEFQAATPYPAARFLRSEYAGLKATQINFSDDAHVRIGKQDPFEEKNIVYADSLFFSVFDFAMLDNFWIAGNPATALSAPQQAVLTESTAKRYFGNGNPVGQIIRLDNKADVEVVGIIRDIPATTHLPINMIVSFSTLTTEFLDGLDPDNWNFTSNGYTYVRLAGEESITAAEQALAAVIQKNAKEEKDRKKQMYLQHLSDIHFDPTFEDSNPAYTVSARYITMLLLLGVFIMLIACVNYINLSTSLAFTKSKEVGIRKTIGASKRQLFLHYMLETLLVTFMAAVLAVCITALTLPYINGLLDKSISLRQLATLPFAMAAFAVLLLVSIISGVYPALIISGYNPVKSLKNQLAMPGKGSVILRRSLVVFQFTTSIALIFCTIVIARQMELFQKKELGFNKEAVVEVSLPQSDSTKLASLRILLQNQKGIKSLSFCIGAPISDNGLGVGLIAPQLPANTEYTTKVIVCDMEYLSTYGLKMLAGRWFLPSEEKNIGTAVVINQALMKTLGYKKAEEAIGHTIQLGLNDIKPTIIGVTGDFHTTSLHKEIASVALTPFPYFYFSAAIKIHPGNMNETLEEIKSAWKKIYPESVYDVRFIDQTLANLYERETKDYTLFKAFSAISIFISCIGLWGLIAFVVVRKTKEIGIRKVLGASVKGIVVLLSKDFIKLIVTALVIASPIAWYFMDQWLQDFAYRITIRWWMFLLAGVLAVLVAVFSISFQAIKAATANPVKNLRTE